MQAKLVTHVPSGEGWLYEVKLDGYRALALKNGDFVRLLSRRNNDLTAEYPRLRTAVSRLRADRVVLDGEIVALDASGRPSFQALQYRARQGTTIAYYAFDVLHRDGRDLLAVPLDERKEMLGEIVADSGLRISDTLDAEASEVVEAVKAMGLEGVIAKRRRSRYEPGQRSGAWIKVKLEQQQEFVIGGYRPGSVGVDALVIGYYVGRSLCFAAKVRAGLTPHLRRQLMTLVSPLHAARCPFTDLPSAHASHWGGGITTDEMPDFQWVRPQLVVQVRFVEWTPDGHLRHAAFVGMRSDKLARAVVREATEAPSEEH